MKKSLIFEAECLLLRSKEIISGYQPKLLHSSYVDYILVPIFLYKTFRVNMLNILCNYILNVIAVWRWYINVTITILDIVHRLVFN
jgi:hypothetical protein